MKEREYFFSRIRTDELVYYKYRGKDESHKHRNDRGLQGHPFADNTKKNGRKDRQNQVSSAAALAPVPMRTR